MQSTKETTHERAIAETSSVRMMVSPRTLKGLTFM
jgi:hypothetical protein